MSDDPIIGVDSAADLDGFRIRWWQKLVLVVVLVGGVGTLIADLIKTDTEQAATTLERFFEAIAASDEEAACEVMTPLSGELLAEAASRRDGAGASCAQGLEIAIGLAEDRGDALPEDADLDPELIAENLEIEGDVARISGDVADAPGEILELERIDGEWLVSLEPGLGVKAPDSGPL